MSQTWFITGASRGLGVYFAKAALAAGHRVIATGRRRAAVTENLGPDDDRLLSAALDVTDATQIKAVADTAVTRFGSIDVLVNNAGYGHLGFFEETSDEDVHAQFGTNVFGVFNVTRALLPSMRAARKGRIFNLSSVAGLRGTEFGSLYCASKFAIEGFSEALAMELAPLGIFVTLIEPGPFRTDFLAPDSLRFGGRELADYDDRRQKLTASFEQRNGQQPGDPAKLAAAVVGLASDAKPPMRFVAGAFGVATWESKLAGMRAELESRRALSVSTDYGS